MGIGSKDAASSRLGTRIATALFAWLLAGPVSAATFNVNSTTDAVDVNPGNSFCATAGGVCTLRAAIQETNALAGVDTINLPAGTYLLTIAGTSENAAATGDLDITDSLTLQGAGARTTIVDGGLIDRVFEARGGTGFAVVISGLTVRNGNDSGKDGGGILNDTTLTLTDVAVSGCLAKNGGGIASNATVTLARALLTGNTSSGGAGAGIYSSGGAARNYLTNVTISGNFSDKDGAGASLDHGVLLNVTITANTLTGGNGSGLREFGGQPLTLKNTIIAGNTGDVQCNSTANLTSLGNNLSSDASCSFTQPGDLQNTNPLLGALANNGGPTDTHALQAGSPAIDTGTNTGAPATDQRGVPRPVDGDGNGSAITDIGAYELSSVATAVSLLSFVARGLDAAVDLEWQTGSETKNLGFHLYRSTSEDGPWERITGSLIPGLGSSPEGARYAYRDLGLGNGVTYDYLLEDVETTGATERHGPVSATPQLGLGGGSGSGGSDSGSGSGSTGGETGDATPRLTFGDPTAASLRILERGRGGVVVELRTGGFYATPEADEDGSVRLSVPGFDSLPDPGLPAIPSRLAWIPALVGRQVKVATVRPDDVIAFDLQPADATAPALVVSRDGTVHAAGRRVTRRFRSADALFPEEPARILETAFQQEAKKALLSLSPLRWDPVSRRLLLARRLTVRLAFAGREEGEIARGDFKGRKPRKSRATPGLLAQLVSRGRGLHAAAFESVFPGGGRPLRASDLALSRLGSPVAFGIVPRPGQFGPGSRLVFWSDGPDVNPDANELVFELSRATGGLLMPSRDASPWGGAASEILATAHFEQNRRYLSALVHAPDPWLWDLVLSPGEKSFAFDLPGWLASSSTPARLTVHLQGGTDFPADPDHHVRLSVNGAFVTEVSWDGMTPRTVTAELPASVLLEAGNRLQVHDTGDTGVAYSLVYLDRFSLDYPRALVAEAGRFEGRATSSGTAVVTGLTAPLLLDTTDAVPVLLAGALASTALDAAGSESCALAFRAEAGRRYTATASAALAAPEVRFPAKTTLRDSANAADWIVVTPRAFAAAAETLASHRQAQGLEAEVVFIEDVFDHFGFGETHPAALRDFLAFAFHGWAKAPRYVLLLGDATYDPKDFYKTGVKGQIPSPTVVTSFLWTASDPLLAAVNGDDTLPDLALGRLTARTPEEAQAVVDKLIAWETAGFTLDGKAVLVSDNPDRGGDFDANAQEIASTLLANRETQPIRLSALGSTATRSAILGAFDSGASLLSYMGHGAASVWASESLFTIWDLPGLSPQPRQPFVLTLNCLNGYFTMPGVDALAEALTKAEGKGAIAAFSPSSMSLNDAAHVYHKLLLAEIVAGRQERLGDALLAAQQAYADSGAFPELLGVYHLFGDPGGRIR